MSMERYSAVFQNLLQSDVEIVVNDKVMKRGVVKLFNVKQYFIKFYIDIPGKDVKIVEIPYPFKVRYDKVSKVCTLNYKLSSLCNNHHETMSVLKRLTSAKTHKFYDSVVHIKSLN